MLAVMVSGRIVGAVLAIAPPADAGGGFEPGSLIVLQFLIGAIGGLVGSIRAIAFRDRVGRVVLLGRRVPLIGFPGLIGTDLVTRLNTVGIAR